LPWSFSSLLSLVLSGLALESGLSLPGNSRGGFARPVTRDDWETDVEARSLAHVGLNLEITTDGTNQLFNNCQANPSTRSLIGQAQLLAVLFPVGCYSDTCVDDTGHDMIPTVMGNQRYQALAKSKAHGIVNQVDEDSLQGQGSAAIRGRFSSS
jgi:hypothetical protein